MSNEAAERLRERSIEDNRVADVAYLDAALAAERKATVERIRTQWYRLSGREGRPLDKMMDTILDAEAAR